MPRQALSAAVKFQVTDEDKGLASGETNYDLIWIVSKELNSRIGEREGGDAGDLFHYGVGMDFQLYD